MTEYVRVLSEMLPGWNDMDTSGAGAAVDAGEAVKAADKSMMGPVSSTLYTPKKDGHVLRYDQLYIYWGRTLLL